jgi:HlyD family secretion protein
VNRKLAIGFVAVAVVVALVIVLWSRSDEEGVQEEDSVRRTQIERGEMVVSVRATGSIVAKAEARLSFDLPGKVSEVWVEVGDSVKMGNKLARVDDTNLALRVRQARAALAAAQAQLDQLNAGTRQGEVSASKANLEAAQARLDGANANLRELEKGSDVNQVAAAEANLRAAQASLWIATIQRDQVQRGASEADIAAAEAQLASALAQQKVARDAHDRTLKCYTVTLPNGAKEEICPALGMIEEQARFNLYAADEAVDAAQAQLDRLQSGSTDEQSDTANANVAVAAARRDAAQAQLDLLRGGTSAEQLQATQANVAALTAQRDAAQAQLDLLLAGASEFQIAVAQAGVDQAQVALEIVQAELDRATLVAPFEGVVTAVNVQAGQIAPATVPAMTLVNLSELQIVVDVDEVDVARLAEGQEVTIRVDALPDETISGYVKRIAPAASQVGGVIVYEVSIVLGDTDLPLRVGMSATASIVIERLQDVLLVPNWAIRIDRDTGRTFVNLVREATVEENEVEIGVRGEDVSQVLSGLQEGDVVVAGDVVGLRSLLERGE